MAFTGLIELWGVLPQAVEELDNRDCVAEKGDSDDALLEQLLGYVAELAALVLLVLVDGLVCDVLTVSTHSDSLFTNGSYFWAKLCRRVVASGAKYRCDYGLDGA
ncbi:hypothetical protein ACFT8V_22450 [Streptomyces griseoincarnatus]